MLYVREMRKMRKISQKELAAKSGVSQQSISQIERDPKSNPGIRTVEALAQAMGLGVMDLYQPDSTPVPAA